MKKLDSSHVVVSKTEIKKVVDWIRRQSDAISATENKFWFDHICNYLVKSSHMEELCEAITDKIFEDDEDLMEEFATIREAISAVITHPDGTSYTLMCLPIFVHSQFLLRNANRPLSETCSANICDCLTEHLSMDPKINAISVLPFLLDMETLPRGPKLMRELIRHLEQNIEQGKKVGPVMSEFQSSCAEHEDFETDMRYLLFVIRSEANNVCFKWQTPSASVNARENTLSALTRRLKELLLQELSGHFFEVLSPACFYTALADSENYYRFISAEVSFLDACHRTMTASNDMIITIANFDAESEEDFNEVRIGFCSKINPETIIDGVIWPLLEYEEFEGQSELIHSIYSTLDVANIITFENTFPAEYCEECGAPFFVTPSGQLGHPTGNSTNPHDPEEAEDIPVLH